MTDGAHSDLLEFHGTVDRITASVVECLQSNTRVDDELENESLPIYIKSADLRLLYSNAAYRSVFAPDALPVGRNGESFLQDTVIRISKASDSLILAGCSSTIFDHFGHDSNGHAMLFRTAKRSLLSIGHPSFAILGITMVCKVLADDASSIAKNAVLADKWNRLMSLQANDREIAIMLAKGLSTNKIAERLDVSKRTVENHRNGILHSLDVPTQLELVKLLVRLQAKGYGDLGV